MIINQTRGTFVGIAPTDKQVSITGINIYRLDHGSIVESWAERDVLGVLRQLGAVPSAG